MFRASLEGVRADLAAGSVAFQALFLVHLEGVGVHPAVDGQVVAGRLQILEGRGDVLKGRQRWKG